MSDGDADYYRAQARRCCRLARGARPQEAFALNQMADEYEAKARQLFTR